MNQRLSNSKTSVNEKQQHPILATKLYFPTPRPGLVQRPHLIERLNKDLHRNLTLISAPAGFGKTTLVSNWINDLQEETTSQEKIVIRKSKIVNRIAWLSLDHEDNDLTRFLNYLVVALQTITKNIGEGVLGSLQSPQPPPIESTLTTLLNEITTVQDNFILVLDDYHIIDSKPVDNALSFLIEHLPSQMHLVIATREDPQLPLARLRVRGQLTELRASDLRFTSSEAAEFLNRVMNLNLSEENIAALETRTEGWIAGLQMAALSMQGREDTAGFIKAFTGSHHFVLDYLVEEVLQRQPEQVRSFLLRTSILDRLTGSLCDFVTGQENSREMLEALERSNLFVVPLDDKRQWYRYHHLFADVLQAHSMKEQSEQVFTLHRRASEWYEQNGIPSDAIHHALVAKDYERAACLAELVWPAMSGSFQSIAWLNWLKPLPDELVCTRPLLCLGYAWAFLNAGKLEAADAKLKDAEQWMEPASEKEKQSKTPPAGMIVVDEEQFRSLPVSIATARAYHAQAIGDVHSTVKYARKVLDLLPEEAHFERGTVTALLALAYWTNGELETAHQTFSDGLGRMNPLDVIVGTFVLAEIKITLGRLNEALYIYEHALQLATEHGEPKPMGTEDAYSGISELHREQGDSEAAAKDLATSRKLGEQVKLPDWQYRWCIAQARLNVSLGDLDGALDLLHKAERLYVRTPLPKVRPIAAMKARVWINQGRLTQALGWARDQGISVEDDLSYLHEFEHITLARLLIAQYRSDLADHTIHKAMVLIECLLQAAEQGGRMGSVIEILMLNALAHEARENITSALVPLERALRHAEPEGYVRIFVDEGEPMKQLLSEAATKGIMPDYTGKLLDAFKADELKSEEKSYLPPALLNQSLIEPLSKRELEVLQLIAKGLSNPDISKRLFIALPTVKGHNLKIFGKLNVQNRTEAVARASELGLL